MTTRRWMATVAIIAMAASAFVGVERARQRTDRLAIAYRDYQSDKARHDEGRLLLERIVDRSRRLMEAELALCWTSRAQAAAIEAHLARAASLIEAESHYEPHKAYFTHLAETAEAEESLLPWRSRLSDLIRPR